MVSSIKWPADKVERWQDFTGRTFNKITEDRHATKAA
jgi:hypothetical protein